jgi:hypothetical protein
MVFVANKPVGNFFAFDMPLVSNATLKVGSLFLLSYNLNKMHGQKHKRKKDRKRSAMIQPSLTISIEVVLLFFVNSYFCAYDDSPFVVWNNSVLEKGSQHMLIPPCYLCVFMTCTIDQILHFSQSDLLDSGGISLCYYKENSLSNPVQSAWRQSKTYKTDSYVCSIRI